MSSSEDDFPATTGKRRGGVVDREAADEDSEVDSSEDEGDDGVDAYEEDGFVVSGDDEDDEGEERERCAVGFLWKARAGICACGLRHVVGVREYQSI